MNTEDMLERSKKLLKLKGVDTEDQPDIPRPSPAYLLELHEKRKEKAGNPQTLLDDMQLEWNADGTLNNLTVSKDDGTSFRWHFAWNADGSLHKMMRG